MAGPERVHRAYLELMGHWRDLLPASHFLEVDYEAVERVRRAQRDTWKAEEGFGLTFLPFVSRAVVDAIGEYPYRAWIMTTGDAARDKARETLARAREAWDRFATGQAEALPAFCAEVAAFETASTALDAPALVSLAQAMRSSRPLG